VEELCQPSVVEYRNATNLPPAYVKKILSVGTLLDGLNLLNFLLQSIPVRCKCCGKIGLGQDKWNVFGNTPGNRKVIHQVKCCGPISSSNPEPQDKLVTPPIALSYLNRTYRQSFRLSTQPTLGKILSVNRISQMSVTNSVCAHQSNQLNRRMALFPI
jgi:hypothetical protein